MNVSNIIKCTAIAASLVLLNACGGDNQSNNNEDLLTSAESTSSRYLFYTAEEALYAVDPHSPQSPILVEDSGVSNVHAFVAGKYQADEKVVDNIHIRDIFYMKGNGIYRVSSSLDEGLAVSKLSSHTFTEPCISSSPDLFDIGNSIITVGELESDGYCSGSSDQNDKWLLRYDSNNDNTPAEITGDIVTAVWDHDSGAIIGALTTENNTLQFVDNNMDNPETLATFTSSVEALFSDGFSKFKILLYIDGDLRVFDPTSKTLSVALHTTGPNFYHSATFIKDAWYFVEDLNIYRIAADGASSSQPLNIGTFPANVYDLEILPTQTTTKTSLTFMISASDGILDTTTIRLIDLETNAVSDLYTTEDPSYGFFVGDLFYADFENSGGDFSAKIFDHNGNVIFEQPGATWSSSSLANHQKTDKPFTFSHALVIETTGTPDMSGAVITAYDDTGSPTTVIGTIPDDIPWIIPLGISGPQSLALALSGDLSHFDLQFDIFYMDMDTDNSLTRVTNTPDLSEDIVL